jgi:hypothetical protein
MSKKNVKKCDFLKENAVYAVAEGIVSNRDTANGKFIPVVIVDTENNDEIRESILLQGSVENGKVITSWGRNKDESIIYLIISFQKPVEKEFVIAFDIDKYVGTIDFIVKTRLLYLQPGKNGEKMSTTIEKPKILMEVPSDDFENEWKNIFRKCFERKLLKSNLNKKQRLNYFNEFYSEWKKLSETRFKR